MVCKNCGFEIEKDWKYCPNCSKRIFKKQRIIIISTIILFTITYISMLILKSNAPVDANYIEK